MLGDEGMSTAEYAIGTLAAAGLAMVLYGIVNGDWVVDAVRGLLEQAFAVDL
ncbi:DUF4244 domain-containing protein [Saccharothrix longispora]|uniref:DUF4244 domain-containing protein n=1 Tax=Saccharothrix longispora TaxID=33920 RepID=A0ABU1Q452_9PSEU|nr:DUF4244 domain-containing protein [Saccharothrix longispora]MDR6597676.1 hypothetical protein [Saccharothrix longispora]